MAFFTACFKFEFILSYNIDRFRKEIKTVYRKPDTFFIFSFFTLQVLISFYINLQILITKLRHSQLYASTVNLIVILFCSFLLNHQDYKPCFISITNKTFYLFCFQFILVAPHCSLENKIVKFIINLPKYRKIPLYLNSITCYMKTDNTIEFCSNNVELMNRNYLICKLMFTSETMTQLIEN